MRVVPIVLAGVLSLGSGSAFAQARANNGATALAAFNHGVDQYDHHDYQAALTSFRASFAATPSPNSRLYIARCLREIGELSQSISEFQATADDAGRRARTEARYAQTRDAARDELRDLNAHVGHLRIDSASLPAGAQVRIDGRDISHDALAQAVVVAPGHISVSVEAVGFSPFHNVVEVAAGAEAPVHIAMTAAPASTTSSVAVVQVPRGSTELNPFPRNLAIVAGGVAIIGWIGFASFGVLANNTYNDVMQRCGMGPCSAADANTIANGRTYDTLANVSLGLGIAGLVAGTAFLVWSVKTGTHHDVAVGVNGTSLTLGGRF